jgi:hypothetical protein
MHPSTQRFLDHLQLGAHPVAARLPPELEVSPPAVPADVGEAKKVERRRFAETTYPPVLDRMASELDEPCLPRIEPRSGSMQRQAVSALERQGELRQARPHILPEPLGVDLMLEADDDVVSVAHHDDVPMSMALPPLLRPQVEDVIQVDVRACRQLSQQSAATMWTAARKFLAVLS